MSERPVVRVMENQWRIEGSGWDEGQRLRAEMSEIGGNELADPNRVVQFFRRMRWGSEELEFTDDQRNESRLRTAWGEHLRFLFRRDLGLGGLLPKDGHASLKILYGADGKGEIFSLREEPMWEAELAYIFRRIRAAGLEVVEDGASRVVTLRRDTVSHWGPRGPGNRDPRMVLNTQTTVQDALTDLFMQADLPVELEFGVNYNLRRFRP